MLVRVLLDEQLPRQLAPHLVGRDVRTVQQESWAGLNNGELLNRRAEATGFSVFLTARRLVADELARSEFKSSLGGQRS